MDVRALRRLLAAAADLEDFVGDRVERLLEVGPCALGQRGEISDVELALLVGLARLGDRDVANVSELADATAEAAARIRGVGRAA